MIINWYGQTCFRINTSRTRNGSVNILIDPPAKESGLRSPKLEADILLTTDKDMKIGAGNYFLIDGSGEYDIKETYVQGIPSLDKKDTIYTIETEDIKICHLGKIGQKELTSDQLEKIGDVDILMIPIGGGQTIDAEEAIKTMARIEPKVIIPMYYQIPKLKIKLDKIDKFLKGLGIKSLQPLPKLSIKKKDISKEEAKVVVLQP